MSRNDKRSKVSPTASPLAIDGVGNNMVRKQSAEDRSLLRISSVKCKICDRRRVTNLPPCKDHRIGQSNESRNVPSGIGRMLKSKRKQQFDPTPYLALGYLLAQPEINHLLRRLHLI